MALFTEVKKGANVLPATGHICVSLHIASSVPTNETFAWIADRDYEIIRIDEVHSTAGSDGGAVTAQVDIQRGTEAQGAGDDVLNTQFNLKGTAETVQNGDLLTTRAARIVNTGNRLSCIVTGTTTALTDMIITVTMVPLQESLYKN